MKVSVITACFNAESTIEETLRSIAGQTYSDIEHIIIDGGSNDNTLSIIEKYKDKVAVLVSEPDNGVYNAMNKGIDKATGDLIFFLNADDVFINEKVVETFANFAKVQNEGLLLGNIILLDKYSGAVFNENHQIIDDIQLYTKTVFHPATFFRKEVFKKYGTYNENNKIASDYEWYLNYFLNNKGDYTYLNSPVSIFSMSGISSSEKHSKAHLLERETIINKYFDDSRINRLKLITSLFPRKINKASFRKQLAELKLNRIY